jgi:hypothetical protein
MANYPLRYSDFTHAGRKDTNVFRQVVLGQRT